MTRSHARAHESICGHVRMHAHTATAAAVHCSENVFYDRIEFIIIIFGEYVKTIQQKTTQL